MSTGRPTCDRLALLHQQHEGAPVSDTLRSVEIERTGLGRYTARNVRGGTLNIGGGDDSDFSPVELLLAAIGGCTAVDVDYITVKRAEPEKFTVTVRGDKIRDEQGNR